MKDYEKLIAVVLVVLVLALGLVTAGLTRDLTNLQEQVGGMSTQRTVDIGQNDNAYMLLSEQERQLLELFELVGSLENQFPLWDSGRLEELSRLAKENEAEISWHLGILNDLNETNIKQSRELGTYRILLCGRINSRDEGLVYEVTGLNCDGKKIDQNYCLNKAIKYGDGDPQRYEFYDECIKEIEQ